MRTKMRIALSQESGRLESPTSNVPSTERSDSVPMLHAIGLRAYRRAAALSIAERGELLAGVVRPWDGTTGATIYMGGRKDTRDGRANAGSWQEFGELMRAYSCNVVPEKGDGWWITPAFSTNGRCRDQDISSIFQVSFDCDGLGDWDVVRQVLKAAGLAHIVQRSSSHRPERPKWHLHIPLFSPWTGNKKQWRRLYRHCVGWFSGAGELRSDLEARPPVYGFDPKTDRLGQPWFLPARRSEQDAAPEIVVVDGGALELDVPGSNGF